MDGLTREQRKELASKGFLKHEIEDFNNAYVNYESATFQSMIRSRWNWVRTMRDVGWSDNKIAARLRHWYKLKKERSPFDWLKIEYRPGAKLTIKQLAMQLKIRRSASRTLGRAYGRIRSLKTMRKIGYKGIPKPPKRQEQESESE